MLNLRPGAPKPKKGKRSAPPELPRPKPASLRSSKRTLAQQLNIRPDVSKEADKLEQKEIKQKEKEAMPKKLLPVPKAIQVVGQDAIRDAYLDRGGIKKAEVQTTKKPQPINTEAKEYADLIANSEKVMDQTITDSPSFLNQLKAFGN